jgi:magnesium transporter
MLMSLFRLRPRFDRPGTAPGTLREDPAHGRTPLSIRRFRYSPGHCDEDHPSGIEQALAGIQEDAVTWIDVVGLDAAFLHDLGDRLKLHPLTLEDVFNTWQRPKLESYDDYLFVVMKLLRLAPSLEAEQLSMFVGPHWVVTIQETDCPPLDPVRARVRAGKGRIRQLGPDYLAYAILDTLVDNFFPLLEQYSDRLEDLETALVEHPDPTVLNQLHDLKKELLLVRRAAWPQREVVNAMIRSEASLVGAETKIFLRDGYDHAVQILDIVETYRDVANGLTDLYLTSISIRTNDVMRVLTVMSSIFIPLTFIAGVYGMNFDPGTSPLNMPELHWYWGYPVAIGLMVLVGGALLIYFKRRGWL